MFKQFLFAYFILFAFLFTKSMLFIINGSPVIYIPGWIVSLRSSEGRVCGGTLISNQWILTASHCFMEQQVDQTNPNLWHIQTGRHYVGDYLWLREYGRIKDPLHLHISTIVLHPDWSANSITYDNDIALIKLKQVIDFSSNTFSRLERVALPNKNDSLWPATDTTGKLIGWGCNTIAGPVVPRAYQAVFKVYSHAMCTNIYRRLGTEPWLNNVREFCAGHLGFASNGRSHAHRHSRRSICAGDSGGGLIINTEGRSVIGGILSASPSASHLYPAIYTRVSSYIDWINSVIL